MLARAGEAIRRQPLGHGGRGQERLVSLLLRRFENAVKIDRARHDFLLSIDLICLVH
jgi:hypothetical protein